MVRLTNTDEEVVYRFASIIVWGKVYGPYGHQGTDRVRWKPCWVWLAEEYEALEVLEMLWPWLSGKRKGQALDLAPLDAILLNAALEASTP